MTPQQKDLFIQIAQIGTACNHDHAFEWLSHYLHTLPDAVPIEEVSPAAQEAISAYAQFFRESASSDADPCRHWTDAEFMEVVSQWHSDQIGNA